MTYDIISCKNAHKVWFLVQLTGENDTDSTLSLSESTDVAGGTAAAVTATFPVWYNQDTVSTTADAMTLVTTEAASYVINIGEGGEGQMVVIEWDPAKHTAGYDCIQLVDASGHGSNTMVAFAFIQPRYQQADPPTAITD